MEYDRIIDEIIKKELRFITSRSSGPGGQNVNKVNTKVELRFDVCRSASLTNDERERILYKLKNRITQDGELVITSQTERTQSGNKEKALAKFHKLISSALTVGPVRKATIPTNASRKERLKKKKQRSAIKKQRQTGSAINDE